MRDELLASKELWTCYACGQCSETCPRQAEPSEFMAASRRYATASYDRTRLARFLFLQPLLGTIAAVVFALLLGLFMFVNRSGPVPEGEMAFFAWVPAGLVHDIGIVAMILVFVAGLAGVLTMVSRVAPASGIAWRSLANREGLGAIGTALWSSLAIESLGQKRYREDCENDEAELAWYRRPWVLHAATMFGFLGLLLATTLDFGLEIVGLRETGEAVPIWYPVRLLGTVAGVVLMWGVTHADDPPLAQGRAHGAPLVHLRLDVPVAAVAGRPDRIRHRAGAVPAAGAGLGLCPLPGARGHRHGAGAAGALHQVRARHLPAGRALPAVTGAASTGDLSSARIIGGRAIGGRPDRRGERANVARFRLHCTHGCPAFPPSRAMPITF